MILRDLIYILQAGNYEIKKFLRFAYTHWRWWELEKRRRIDWTMKARAIYFLALWLYIFIIIGGLAIFSKTIWLLIVIIATLALPLIISVSLIIFLPLDFFLKRIIISKANGILREYRGRLTVIGIAGSYGKTSAKEILFSILSEKFRVIKLDKNINTDIGIAGAIIEKKNELAAKDIFIVEMGAYRLGEIKNICDLVSPDYSILTGINEAHLEKFGSLDNTIKAKFELPEATKNISILNFDDKNVAGNYKKFKIKAARGAMKKMAVGIKVLENFQGLEFIYEGVKFKTKLLAEHNISLIMLCLEAAKILGMTAEEAARGLNKMGYIPHRLELIRNAGSDIWIIDDSYNGNFEGFKSGIEVLKRAAGRKIVLTPGLVEQGERKAEIHKKIGGMYARERLNLVLLIKNEVSGYIKEGMGAEGFKNYKIYNSTAEAHNDLKNILRPGDTIVFQNDWPDNYF